MDFTNKTVLVTGSSRGIGKAIAFAFGRAGARVVLNASRSKDQLAEAKKELEEMGVSCMAILADVSDYNACKDMFLQIQDKQPFPDSWKGKAAFRAAVCCILF